MLPHAHTADLDPEGVGDDVIAALSDEVRRSLFHLVEITTRNRPSSNEIAPRNVTGRNLPCMADERWRGLSEPWERLRWARSQRFETVKDGAVHVGMRPNTYSAYERRPDSSKHSQMDHQQAMHFANRFKVRWEWLLLGKGEPYEAKDEPPPTEPMVRALKVMRGVSPAQQEAIATAIEALARTRAGKR